MAKIKRMNSETLPVSGEAFKAFRRKHELSERDASALLGMSRQYLRNCEERGGPLYLGYALAALDSKLRPHGVSGMIYWSDDNGSYKIKARKKPQKKK